MFTYLLSFSSPFHFYINTFSFSLFPVQMAKTTHTHRENEAMRLRSVNLIIHENNMQQMFLTLFSQ